MPIPTKEKIVEAFNQSVTALEKAHSAAAAKDVNLTLTEIATSAGLVYSALEWFLKNFLDSIFPDPLLNINERNIIEGNNFHKKVDLFNNNAVPSLLSQNIDISTIKTLKQSVRNDAEHSGVTPHYNSLIIVLKNARQLINIYSQISLIKLKEIPQSENFELKVPNEWFRMFPLVEKFSKDYNYILLTDKFRESPISIKPLALIDWKAIIDLDNNSEVSGLYSIISTELESRASIHKFTLNDTLPTNFSDSSCYWIFGNGLHGRTNTIISEFRYWNSSYSAYLQRIFNKLQLAISSKPTIVIILTDNVKYTTEIVKLIFNSFLASVKFVFATNDLSIYMNLADEYQGEQVEISVSQFTTGLLTVRSYFDSTFNQNTIVIPHKDSEIVTISQSDYIWLKEDLDLFHKFIFQEADDSDDERIDFYKGGGIGLKGLMMNYDLPRDFISFLELKVEKSLRERIFKAITLFHYPGVGGTTISKRIAWKLKDRYPVVIIKNYRPTETINRIYKLFQLSSLPPLVLMDSENINSESRERIQNEALTRTFPVTFLEVQRKLMHPVKLTADQLYLSEILSDEEVVVFAKSYSELAPTKTRQLNAIRSSKSIKEKHPLFFGLTAFEEDFNGLQEFVLKAFQSGNSNQKRIIAFISLCGVFAQKGISDQSFTHILALPESVAVKLEDHLNESLLHLVVRESQSVWRPLHYLVAKQYLKTLYGGDENQMRIGLSDLSIDFIELIGNKASNPTREEYEILDRLFIERYDEDIENEEDKPFSKLIQEGLIDENSRLRVFVKLTETFPDQAHFWSHLARFYNLVIKDQSEALICIDKAIELDIEYGSKDSTLHHIKGMILKSEAAALMQKNWSKINVDPTELQSIKDLIMRSNNQFEIARELNANSDYGYITNIDAITHYLDFKFKKSSTSDRSIFLTNLDDFDLKLFTKARMLLEEVRSKLHHNEDDYFYLRSKNRLKEYYNNYSSIIQSWQNLLNTSSNNKLEIRQNLVHAYVGRVDGWEKLTQRDIDKILRLLNDNINDDPMNSKNIFLWFKAARYSQTIRIMDAIPKLVKWRSLEPSLEVNFYLSVLYIIEAINGNSVSARLALNLIRDVSEKSRSNPFRSFQSEWLGKGIELAQIKPKKAVISQEEMNREYIFDVNKLQLVEGKISKINGPEKGEIEFASGIIASFIPARGDGGRGFVRGRDENKDVKFILAFTYDGPKAFEVSRA